MDIRKHKIIKLMITHVVLVEENNSPQSPPLHWPLAKIIEIHPGSDSQN